MNPSRRPFFVRWSGLACLATVLGVLGTTSCAPVAPRDSATLARTLESELMSPFCPGLLLSDCPSPNAAVLRTEITSRIGRGEAPSAITDDLVARYGAQILGSPPAEGFGLLLWIVVPAVALVSGVTLILALLHGGTSPAGGNGHLDALNAPVPTPQRRRRLEQLEDELSELD